MTCEEFLEYRRANPELEAALAGLCREAVAAGRTKGSIRLFFERLRWDSYVNSTDPDFKLNNNTLGWWARWMEHTDRVPRNFFEKRALRSLEEKAEQGADA